MGYGDNRYSGGDNRSGGGRDQDRWDRERSSYGSWGSERDRERSGSGGDDRGFMDRAGDEVRSWFGDDEAQRRREMDERRWEREHRMSGDRNNDYRGSTSFGGGFGNQRGWGDDHFDRQREQGRGSHASSGREDQHRYSERGGYAGGGGGGGAETWGGSGFGGPDDNGRRFDRIDAGHVGSQGAHPMSAPVSGGYASGGAGGSSARSAAILRNAEQGRHGGGQSGGFGGGIHDPHYHEHRQRQIEELDRDYDEYRREHQSRFEQEFGGWREKRQTQRKHMSRVTDDMQVLGSDGELLGTVDKVRGDRIILKKSDPNAGGMHHSIPCSWIEAVDDKVTINKSAQEAMTSWRNEDHSRALFEREDQGESGPHMLNRSFSGTYSDRDDK